ncbi:MAG: hypothetical protein F6K47_07160 [Symploca sp. SIO2E6]|nr:hypothetical protein [Symploca sp. SIO2E6]
MGIGNWELGIGNWEENCFFPIFSGISRLGRGMRPNASNTLLGFTSPSTDATRTLHPTYIFSCATLV